MREGTPGRSRTTGPARRERGAVMAVVRGDGLRTGVMLNREAAPMFPMVLAYERKGAMPAGRLITCAMILGLLFAGGPPVRAESNLTLPTPRSHYETFKPGISGLPLLQNLLQGLDPQTQRTVLTFLASSHLLNGGSMADLSSPDANALLNMAHAAGISGQTTLSKGQAPRSTEGTELESLETALIGVCRSSIAGVRHDSGEVSTFLLPYRA